MVVTLRQSPSMKTPSKSTLKRYGLSLDEWLAMANEQDNKCFICREEKEVLCVDHHHVKGWKKMKPQDRKKHVRGLLCIFCNLRLLPKGMSLKKARNIVRYLERYESKLS